VPIFADGVRRLAEEPETVIKEAPPPTRRITTPSFILSLSPSPSQALVTGVRTTVEDLDATIQEVRKLLREAKYTGCVWTLGPSCQPAGLVALLAERGFVPVTRSPYEAVQTGMALASPPPALPVGVEARMVRDFDEYVLAIRIAMEAFGESEEATADWISAAPTLWAHGDAARLTHLAFVDGKPVGFGFAVRATPGLLLGGSGVLSAARGRGAYRALIAARWALAVKLGTPALVIQAGAMSRPILERCGFEAICRLDSMDDSTIWDESRRDRSP
jgi:GNAT superfamily N-acetyltransferase